MNCKNKSFVNNKNAFTLIELLIVIAIIGILFIVLVSKVDFATDKANATGVQTDFRSFQIAFDTVATENAGFTNLVTTDYEALESAINKHLDTSLKINIDAMGKISMVNGTTDPWKVPYHGEVIFGDDGKDRGAIVMCSNGANMLFGSDATISGGIVTITTTNESGKDDYVIVSCYSLKNGAGSVLNTTVGFSNNQTASGEAADSNNSGNSTNISNGGVYESETGTMISSWDKLINDGIFVIDNGVLRKGYVVPSGLQKNEYGFYFDTEYTMSSGDLIVFYENGSGTITDCNTDEVIAIPEGTFQYSNGMIGVSNDGKTIHLGDDDAYLGKKPTIPGGKYIIPSNFGIKEFESELFMLSTVTEIQLPEGVVSIGDSCFNSCDNLTTVVLPNTLVSIGKSAFFNCNSLANVTIPNSVQSIGRQAFWGCAITDIEIPEGVTELYYGTFAGSNITTIRLPDSLTSIGDGVFQWCSNLTTIIIPDNVQNIGSNAFQECTHLTTIAIPDKVTTIQNNTFYKCTNLVNVVFSTNLTSIGDDAFYYCESLQSVTLPNSLLYIGEDAFYRCSELTGIVVPDNVIEIGNSAFGYCSKLSSVVIGSSVNKIGQRAFDSCPNLNSVTFKNPNGWWRATSATATSGTTITGLNLSSTTAVSNLKSTYSTYYWFRT